MDSEAVFFAFGAGVVYVVAYTLMAPWWRSPVGRSLVSLVVSIELVLAPSVLHRVAGLDLTHPWFRWYFWLSMHLVGLVILWRVVVAYRIQRRGQR